jgi:branched-chain amino acid transport system permease protein
MNTAARDGLFWIGAATALVLAALAPRVVPNEYYFFAGYVVLQYVVLATAWNILGGYAGYVNFGTAAFFGVGVYSSVVVIRLFGAPLFVQIFVAAIVSGLLGFATGLLTLRLRGIFFSIATIAITIIIETIVVNWRYVGGATGVPIIRPPVAAPFESHAQLLFVVMTVLAIISVSLARYIETSWIGRGLRAIRDTEVAAECAGVPTLKLKLFACVASGALMGAAGAPLPMYVSYIEPVSTFSLNYSILALAMAVIGGTSRWAGPLIGAVLLGTTQQLATVTITSELNLLVVGILLVVFVVAAPEGVIGLFKRVRRLWRM